jgi:hypothetical protein
VPVNFLVPVTQKSLYIAVSITDSEHRKTKSRIRVKLFLPLPADRISPMLSAERKTMTREINRHTQTVYNEYVFITVLTVTTAG